MFVFAFLVKMIIQIYKTYSITNIPPHDVCCVICRFIPNENNVWRELYCKYKLHPKCIDPWLKIHKTYPLC